MKVLIDIFLVVVTTFGLLYMIFLVGLYPYSRMENEAVKKLMRHAFWILFVSAEVITLYYTNGKLAAIHYDWSVVLGAIVGYVLYPVSLELQKNLHIDD